MSDGFEETSSGDMKPATYFLETFGCQMNVLDSQLVEGQLRARGMRAVDSSPQADVILFNTCSVRQHAEDKVLSRLGQLKKLKSRRPEVIVGVIGCMAEREKEGLFVKAPQVDLLCGPGELNRLLPLLDEVIERQEKVAALTGTLSRRTETMARALQYDSIEELDQSRRPTAEENTLQSYIRVQRGCDKFCTYCVVPFTRGAERSRAAEHIVREARMLAERGCREVTLLGQTVNSYVNQEDGRPVRFAELLERVHAVEGLDRIRFVTSFPADWDDDIFRVMRDFPRIMPYLHIPAQSGSDAVLKRMKRGYTGAEYLALMDRARKFVPHIALAGDFIVGFCGETAADFEASLDLLRRVEYKSLFVFKYSPRPGTSADRAQLDDISDETKHARNQEMLAAQAEISLRHKQAFVGREVELLVEGASKLGRAGGQKAAAEFQPESEQDRGGEAVRNPHATASGAAPIQLVGRTPGDLIVVFDAPAAYVGALVNVHIERATALTMFGRVTGVVSPPRPATVQAEQEPAANGFRLAVLGGPA
ncbi:MAG: tRNA (N6-isopentenyl adenosine(37)-C2)-methylthiotransferase MiaB [Planctomycetes bacterium]|nr:tRNA (N6-isopentenyl adenosine(37)-C2)-methylthiotransferase MiaB [Planctomycetota bacterium]